MGQRETLILLIAEAIAISVACILLLDPFDWGLCESFEDYRKLSAHLLGPAILVSVPNFLLGYTKITSNEPFFSNKRFKSGYKTKNKATELEVFKGREAKLNLAIFLVLGYKEPQTTREICKKVNQVKGRKHFSYSTVNRRVRSLEEQLYIKKTEVKQRLGGITNYYELRPKAHLAKFLNSTNMNNMIEQVNDETAVTLLGAFFTVTELEIKLA
jgi:predicted transcriptional regulator